MQFSVWYNIDNERNKKGGGAPMKKESVIKITVTDDNITLDGVNPIALSKDDIIDSIKMLISLAETLDILMEGDAINGNA